MSKKAAAPEESTLMVGLEIHFQLKGRKLFCDCSTEGYGVKKGSFERRLSPTVSEMGAFDPAAEYEKKRDRTFMYVPSDNSCLVEADEEPPHSPSRSAIETGLMVARALGCATVDSVMFMRKMVVDGSNTSGFQRTAVIAFNGRIGTSRGDVRISSVCVEEDSARKLEAEEKGSYDIWYSLDRLGVPLLEIATEPDIVDSEHAMEVARSIGYIVASTGKSRRQVDSIRQDVNISLGYGRVEIKGIQKLSLIGQSISHEIERQRNVSRAVSEFVNRGGLDLTLEFTDVSDLFAVTSSKMLKSAFKKGERIFCTVFPNMNGLLKNGEFRLGKDLSDIAKAYGLGGILHTDELPAFGITEEEVEAVRSGKKLRKNDALVLIVTSRGKETVIADALAARMEKLSTFDFSETRGPNEDGSTKFLRPLPGKERMYPETDVPVMAVDREMLESVESFVPRSEAEVASDLVKRHDISQQEAGTIASAFMVDEFEHYADLTGNGRVAARIMLQTIPEVEKKHRTTMDRSQLDLILQTSAQQKWQRSRLEEALDLMASEHLSAQEAGSRTERSALTSEELSSLVNSIIKESGRDIRPGSLIAKLKEKTEKTFDPKAALRILQEMN